jgi:dUTP pyrophosphatase
MIYVKKLTETAEAPVRAHVGDAGLDLHSDENILIMPRSRAAVRTGVAVAIPIGWYGRVAPRSGLAVKHGLDVLAGTIDAGYRGEILVVLFNTDSLEPCEIRQGERIAQLIVIPCEQWDVALVPELPASSSRGLAGFGSTGR